MALTKITSRILDSSGVTILGTIATGVWQGTAINQTYLVGQSGTNTGDETLARINALDVTELGTISSGVWNGTAIASAYLDADTAHLSTTQTFTGAKTFSSNAIFTGNVGIGTTSPTAILDVRRGDADGKIAEFHTSTGYGLEFGSSQAQAYINSGSSQSLAIGTNNSTKLTITSGGFATFSGDIKANGVRAGRDFSIANRGTVRIDSNGNYPADILFGRDAAADDTSWNGTYWIVSSRQSGTGSAEQSNFSIWRGQAHSSPYNTENEVFVISPSLNVGIGITTPLHALHVKADQNQPAMIESPNADTWLDLKSTAGTWSLGSMSDNAFGVYNRTNSTNPFKILHSGLIDNLHTTVFSATGLNGNTKNGVYIIDQNIYSLAGGNSRPLNIQAEAITFHTGTTYAAKANISANGILSIGTTPSGYLTSGYVLRLHGGAQTYIAFNNNTHTTQVTGGMVIGNDANSAWIVQRENQPLIFSTNNANRLTISSGGDATFSGSITAPTLTTSGTNVFTGSTPLTFHKTGSDTYNKTVVYDAQNNTTDNAFSGITIEMAKLTNSNSAAMRNFTISNRGATQKYSFSRHGLSFNQATASANNSLDDYEQGTWDPTPGRTSGTQPTVSTYAYRDGTFTKVGRLVVVMWDFAATVTAQGSSAAISIKGLPFPVGTAAAGGGAMAGYTVANFRASSLYASSTAQRVLGGFAQQGDYYIYVESQKMGTDGFASGGSVNSYLLNTSSARSTGFCIYFTN